MIVANIIDARIMPRFGSDSPAAVILNLVELPRKCCAGQTNGEARQVVSTARAKAHINPGFSLSATGRVPPYPALRH